jgi:DNA mismatch repair ATPase MutL
VVDPLNKLPDSGESCTESLEVSGYNKQSGNKGRPKKKTKRVKFSYKTILSLCLISGLSVGVGTAFANDVQPPDKFRSLEPAANVNVEEELDLPPKDPDIEKSEKVTSTSQKTTSDEAKNESQNTETKNNSPTAEVKTTPTQSSEQKASEVTSTNQDGEKKALTTSQPANQTTTSTKPTENNKSSEGDPTPSPPPNKPVTESGGKLPDTAGRDLEGVLFGGLIAILGALYILVKGRKAKKS